MANYSDFERKVIASIVAMDSTAGGPNVLGNIWEDFFPNTYIVKLAEATLSCIHIRKSAFPVDHLAFAELDKKFRTQAYRLIRLFDRLEKEGFIEFVGISEVDILGEHFVDEDYLEFNIKDHKLLDQIRAISRRQILVYPDLHELVNNDFVDSEVKKTREEALKYRRTLWIALGGLFLSVLGTTFTAIDKFFKTNPGPTKVEITNPSITIQVPDFPQGVPAVTTVPVSTISLTPLPTQTVTPLPSTQPATTTLAPTPAPASYPAP